MHVLSTYNGCSGKTGFSYQKVKTISLIPTLPLTHINWSSVLLDGRSSDQSSVLNFINSQGGVFTLLHEWISDLAQMILPTVCNMTFQSRHQWCVKQHSCKTQPILSCVQGQWLGFSLWTHYAASIRLIGLILVAAAHPNSNRPSSPQCTESRLSNW